jgi:hypothetical protein
MSFLVNSGLNGLGADLAAELTPLATLYAQIEQVKGQVALAKAQASLANVTNPSKYQVPQNNAGNTTQTPHGGGVFGGSGTMMLGLAAVAALVYWVAK